MAEQTAMPVVDVSPDDDLQMLFTSGSTGNPKGAVSTHRNVISALLSWELDLHASWATGLLTPPPADPPPPQTAMLLAIPLFHVTGCHGLMLGNFSSGGKLVMMQKWDPVVALELIEQERINIFSGVPSMVRELLDVNETEKRDLSTVTALGDAERIEEIARMLAGDTVTEAARAAARALLQG